MRITTLILAAGLLVPATLTAQDSTTTTGAEARIDAAMSSAVKAGIPTSLLERKVAEGKAKGVSMDRIAGAVQKRLDALSSARDAMTSAGLTSTTEGELSVAADAIQAGVSTKALASLSGSAPVDSRAVAIAVLADLVTVGQTSEQALSQVRTALSQGPEALVNLDAQVAGGQSAAGLNAAGGVGGAGVQIGSGAGARVELGTSR